MRFRTHSSPHMIPAHDVGRLMRRVLYALVPGTLAMTWYFGLGVLVNVMLAVVFAVGFEALMLLARRRPVIPVLGDYSAVVTGWLFALALPPLTPWWVTLVGVGFAIVVAKHLYGGLGYNPFNPAMVGYVVVLLSFPRELILWVPPMGFDDLGFSISEVTAAIFLGQLPRELTWDMITTATPLDHMKTELAQNRTISEIREHPLFGNFSGHGWEWIANWFLLGGLWLLFMRVISWQIPVAVLGSLAFMAGAFWIIDPDAYSSPAFHVFSGASILCAFFIATDPVSASTTPRGRLVYGAGIGILLYVIRTWGNYPDAVAFAVLLMNMAAPTIDHYTQPRAFGQNPPPPRRDNGP